MIPRPRGGLKAFPQAERDQPKTRMRGGMRYRWRDRAAGRIYEWDYQHGRVEVYDQLGRHLGEFDPDTGEQLRPANPQRRITPLEMLIVGYGADGRVAVERTLPRDVQRLARKLANVPADDPDLALAYPLTEDAARKIADVPPSFTYFLEAAAN